jgi:hypothetical protein
MSVIKLVQVFNPKNNQVFLSFSGDPKDTLVIPPKAKKVLKLTQEQINQLSFKQLQYSTISN